MRQRRICTDIAIQIRLCCTDVLDEYLLDDAPCRTLDERDRTLFSPTFACEYGVHTPLKYGMTLADAPQWICQKPVKAAKTLGMFRPPKLFNSAQMERMTPSMDCPENKESIDKVKRSFRALFSDSGGQNVSRVLSALTGFWHIHCAHRVIRCRREAPRTTPIVVPEQGTTMENLRQPRPASPCLALPRPRRPTCVCLSRTRAARGRRVRTTKAYLHGQVFLAGMHAEESA